MHTKETGTLTEYALIHRLLKDEYRVLLPIGDCLPYDVAIDIGHQIIKIQVKTAWETSRKEIYTVDARRRKTNRKVYKFGTYKPDDFDFLAVHIESKDVWYIIPIEHVLSTCGAYTMSERTNSVESSVTKFREAWGLIRNMLTNMTA